MMSQPKLPFKSVAGALLFSVLLGPLGLLYSSVLGGSILMFLMFALATSAFWQSFFILWLVSCVWSVVAVNRYNKKILRTQ
ncbi:MAG: hypothetical protein V4501_10430 [Pseudomonadota bacterium]